MVFSNRLKRVRSIKRRRVYHLSSRTTQKAWMGTRTSHRRCLWCRMISIEWGAKIGNRIRNRLISSHKSTRGVWWALKLIHLFRRLKTKKTYRITTWIALRMTLIRSLLELLTNRALRESQVWGFTTKVGNANTNGRGQMMQSRDRGRLMN
jgi:hypothetical protein